MSVATLVRLLCTAQLVLAASAGVGDVVASAIGLTKSLTATSASVQTTPSITPTAAPKYNSFGNSTSDACYMSWLGYWSVSRSALALSLDLYNSSILGTTTWISKISVPAQAQSTNTQYDTLDETVYSMDGAFTISTQTIDTTEAEYVTYRSDNASTYTQIQTFTEVTYFKSNVSVPPTPTCTLPSVIPQCQSQVGGTVQLLYWPAATSVPSNGSLPSTASPIPTAAGPVTAVTLGTTLTSPTFYVSYKNVYAANACGGVGSTLSDTIIAIPTEVLSSVYGGYTSCDAHERPTQEWTATAFFNVTDLNSPVPYSIYSSQPWCATYVRNQGCSGTCSTTQPYRPIIVVPDDVLRSLDPAWATCSGDIRGVYDPPKALTAVSSAAQVTIPLSSSATAAATPGSSPSQPATRTLQASAGEDTLPSSSSQASSSIAQSSQTSSSQDPGGILVSVLGASVSSSVQGSLTPKETSDGAQSQLQYSPDSTSFQDPGGVAVSTPGASDSGSVQGSQTPIGGAQSQPQDSSDSTSTQNIGIVLASILGGGAGSSGVEGSPDSTETGGDPGNIAIAAGQTTVSTLATVTASRSPIGVVIASGGSIETLAIGGPAVPQGGQQLTAEPTNAVTVIGTGADATFIATGPTDPPLVTIGFQIFTLGSLGSTGVVLVNQGTTLTVGSDANVVTIGGQTVRAGPSGEVIVGSSTLTLPPSATFIATASTDQPVVTVGSQVFTLSSLSGGTGKILPNQETIVTIGPDGSVVAVDGQTVHAGPSAEVIVGSSRLNLPPGSSASYAGPAITNAKSSGFSAPSGTTPTTSGSSALKIQATTVALCLAIVFAYVQAPS
ncbi:hypothetical protein LTR49_026932 [Elasticomyces elasticus]|nr:hypothetical protein LTR49_026932 [Elasticomyces elasticus]